MLRINMAEIEFEEKRLHDLCREKDHRIKALEAELAAANAKIKLVYDYDSNLIDALERAK